MNRKLLFPLLVLIAAVLLALLMMANKPHLEPKPVVPVYSTVKVQTVALKALQLTVQTQGTVAPRTVSNLIPEVSGKVVWKSPQLVSGGEYETGQLLLRLEEGDYQTAVARSESALVKATADLEAAQSEYERIQTLVKQKLASQSQLDQAKRVFRVASAGQNEAQINLTQARRDLTRTQLYAPFSGRVRQESIDVGQFVSRGETIATLYANDYVEVRVPITSQQFAYLNLTTRSTGQLDEDNAPLALVSAQYADQPFHWSGQLVRLESEVDPKSRLFYGVVRVRNQITESQPPLAVGLFAQVEIKGRQVDNIVTLPRVALRDDNHVLVVDESNRLHFRQVTLLRLQHDEVLISAGLQEGERVCVSPLQVVVEGMQVNPLPLEQSVPTVSNQKPETTLPAAAAGELVQP